MLVNASSPGHFGAGSQNRVLAIGVAVSILAHTAMLLLISGVRQGPAASTPAVTVIIANIVSPVHRNVPPPAPQASRSVEPGQSNPPVKPTPEPPQPVLARPDTLLAPAATTLAAEPPKAAPMPLTSATTAPALTASAATTPSAAPATAARAPEAQASIPTLVPPTAAKPPESSDAGSLDQYRIALLGAANRYKRYPAIAMEKGWTGKVEVRITIGPNGMTQSVVVKTSSGFDVLDRTAVDMITKAKPTTPLPPSLRGREFVVDIPVIFSLQAG